VQRKTQQGNVYINEEHREAGSERNKRSDFTIDSVQGQKLITTEFEHGPLVRGISEVVWRENKGGYWNPEWAGTCQQLF